MQTQTVSKSGRTPRLVKVIVALLATVVLATACTSQAEVVAVGREEPAAPAAAAQVDPPADDAGAGQVEEPAPAPASDEAAAPQADTDNGAQATEPADQAAPADTTEAAEEDTAETDPAETDPAQTEPAEAAEAPAEATAEAAPIAEPTDVSVFGIDMHANGSQAVVDRIVHVPGETLTVHGHVMNGSEGLNFLRFDNDDTRLTDSNGSTYELIEGFDSDGMINGETVNFSLVFEAPDAGAQLLGVELNVRFDDQGELSESQPGFTIEPTLDFHNGGQAPLLPAPLPVFDSIAHPTGDIMSFDGLRFSETHIAIGFSFTTDVATNGFYGDETFLTDDLGNRYGLVFLSDDRRWTIRDDELASGYLVFGGRIHPDAKTLSLTVNSRGTDTSESFGTGALFTPDAWALDATFAPQTVIAPIAPNTNTVHANGTDVTLHRIDFEQARSVVSVTAIYTGDDSSIELNSPGNDSYLLDNLGNRYKIQDLADNGSLRIASGEGIEGQLTFNGRIDAGASAITLVLNDGNDPEAFASTTSEPQFEFGPFPLTREQTSVDAAGALSAIPEDFGIWTVVNFGEIAESQAQEAALLVSEFDGIEIPGGIRLTLPEGILFDFDRSDLRPEAQETIGKLIEILAYYEGDPITILGHTDSRGSDEYNLALSDDRAAAVSNALVAGGVPASLLSTEGRGETDPVATNDTDEGRQENRRVEVEIMTDKGLPTSS